MPPKIHSAVCFILLFACLVLNTIGCQSKQTPIVGNSVHSKLQVESATFGPASQKEKIWMLPRGKQVFDLVVRDNTKGNTALIVPPNENYVCVLNRLVESRNGNRIEQGLQQVNVYQLKSSSLPNGAIRIEGEIEVVPAPKMTTDGTFWLKVIDKKNEEIFVQQYDYLR